jgi:prolyl-tRNA synthetase
MKYSKLFGKTLKETPKDATLISHKLLYQAGFIRESTAGRYFFLPLGMRVMQKIQQIIKEEMDAAGGQEMVTPVLHPKALWEETNRTTSVGFELMSINDRNNTAFVLGGTAEEMMVDVVRKFQISYKDLPFTLYQFSTKFRDELRARGGLLRVREFVMKDAYSFHVNAEDFKKEYENMWQTYSRIFERLGLHAVVVESDNGYIGGEYCHEFVVESPAGESKFFMTEDGSYAAHEEVATFKHEEKNTDAPLLPMKPVKGVRGTTMEDGVTLHDLPLWQQIKDVLFVDDRGRFILAVIRGDYDVNETKLLRLVKAYTFRHATPKEIREKLHSEPGFLSPVGIKDHLADGVELVVVADNSLRTVHNAYGGNNALHSDLLNINSERDYTADIEGDIALVQEGCVTEDGKKLVAKRGIEVGNIFQLGLHYSSRMQDATYTDVDGKQKPYYMGCYGLGVARTMATIVEKQHDEKGIIWQKNIAPFAVHLVALKVQEQAEAVYQQLQDAGIDVLYDDREDVSAGQKFADADLIGIPVRLVVSAKTQEKVEWKERVTKESEIISVEECLKRLQKAS